MSGALERIGLDRRVWRWVIAVAAVLLIAYPLLSDDLYYQNMIILSLVLAIGAVGLNIIVGYAGYISLGQSAFIGLGAYTVGIATIWRMNRAAIVMITNANPRVRIAITPSSAANAAATSPATGTQTNGSPPIRVVAIPTV